MKDYRNGNGTGRKTNKKTLDSVRGGIRVATGVNVSLKTISLKLKEFFPAEKAASDKSPRLVFFLLFLSSPSKQKVPGKEPSPFEGPFEILSPSSDLDRTYGSLACSFCLTTPNGDLI
ncbi:MAG: hypothetical protein GY737_17155 [Desulfobacteraceae bacterium]|nr:hypothetical protein [Desulfobacteraceae bacterium]